MKMLTAVALQLATLSSAGLAAQEPSAEKPPAVEFNWPVPGKVVVTDTVLKDGKSVKMRYTLKISRPKSGRGLLVQYRDFAFLEVSGHDVTTPRFQKVLAPSLAMASAIPDFLISEGGVHEQVIGFEEMINRVETIMSKIRKVSPEVTEKTRAMFRRPQFKKLIETAMSKYWDAWVGAWLEFDVPAGESTEREVELPCAGVTLPATVRTTHHGAVRGRPGYVRLSIRTVARGEKVRAAGMAILSSLGAAPLGELRGESKKSAVRVENHVEVVTRLDNLRPAWVKTTQIVSVQGIGKAKPHGKIERHEYVFDWGEHKK